MKLDERIDHLAELPGATDEGTDSEARRQIRYPLRALVSFTWFGLDGKRHDAKGTSRNISEGGAYIASRCCPQVGAQIILVFRFLRMPAFSPSQRLEMNGQVVRTESFPDSKGIRGFAVASIWTAFLDQQVEDDWYTGKQDSE